MEVTSDIPAAIRAIKTRDAAQQALLERILDHGGASKLVFALTKRNSKSREIDDDSVTGTMEELESFADLAEAIACTLMAALWPIASKLMLHEVCDSIDLWIASCKAKRLTDRLARAARSEPNESIRRHFEGWVQHRLAHPEIYGA